jgi:hypothetical protein
VKTTAGDAVKAVIAFLKSFDDARAISVESVEPNENEDENEWIVFVTLTRTPSEDDPSWKRFRLRENLDGNLEVISMFDVPQNG